MEWWKQYYEAERGLLHRIIFFRVVLDECQAVKVCYQEPVYAYDYIITDDYIEPRCTH